MWNHLTSCAKAEAGWNKNKSLKSEAAKEDPSTKNESKLSHELSSKHNYITLKTHDGQVNEAVFPSFNKRLILDIVWGFPDGRIVQLVPDNSMMTYGVLIEPGGAGKGSSRWVWTSASRVRTDEENEWRAECRSGCSHSLEVSLRANRHPSNTGMRVMKEREQRKERRKHKRDDSDAQRQSKTLRPLVFRENTNF